MGTMLHPLLPQADFLDTLSADIHRSFLRNTARDDHRWALSRVLLDMNSQWWWFGTALTPWQRDELVVGIRRQYDERHRRPVAIAHCPWSRDTAVMLLLASCRDALVDMALGAAIRF